MCVCLKKGVEVDEYEIECEIVCCFQLQITVNYLLVGANFFEHDCFHVRTPRAQPGALRMLRGGKEGDFF